MPTLILLSLAIAISLEFFTHILVATLVEVDQNNFTGQVWVLFLGFPNFYVSNLLWYTIIMPSATAVYGNVVMICTIL